MYRQVDLFYEPVNEPYGYMTPVEEKLPLGEMSRKEQAFICALIRDLKPRKVLEIGVAAGGTTAVIANCLTMISPGAEMHSIDLNERYYRMPEKAETGYLFEQVKHKKKLSISHSFHFGRSAPFFIEKIGDGIDFLILDTMHIMPGEILDYLCVAPYLANGAAVVIHDVNMNLISSNNDAYATRLLFSTANTDEKYYDFSSIHNNIAAFRISEKARDDVHDLFSVLSVSWKYMPSMADLKNYQRIYGYYYEKGLMDEAWFKKICFQQQKALISKKRTVEEEASELKKMAGKNKRVYIYGNAMKGEKAAELIGTGNFTGFCVSDGYDLRGEVNENVFSLSRICEDSVDLMIIAADSADCYWNVIEKEWNHIVLSDSFWKYHKCM